MCTSQYALLAYICFCEFILQVQKAKHLHIFTRLYKRSLVCWSYQTPLTLQSYLKTIRLTQSNTVLTNFTKCTVSSRKVLLPWKIKPKTSGEKTTRWSLTQYHHVNKQDKRILLAKNINNFTKSQPMYFSQNYVTLFCQREPDDLTLVLMMATRAA